MAQKAETEPAEGPSVPYHHIYQDAQQRVTKEIPVPGRGDLHEWVQQVLDLERKDPGPVRDATGIIKSTLRSHGSFVYYGSGHYVGKGKDVGGRQALSYTAPLIDGVAARAIDPRILDLSRKLWRASIGSTNEPRDIYVDITEVTYTRDYDYEVTLGFPPSMKFGDLNLRLGPESAMIFAHPGERGTNSGYEALNAYLNVINDRPILVNPLGLALVASVTHPILLQRGHIRPQPNNKV